MTADDDARPLILTAGDRLARALREDLNLAERAAGQLVWRTPQVKSLRQWIADVWAESWPSEQLLDATQMAALWLEAVERDRHGVISASACAREARAAEQLAQDYALDLDDEPAYSDEQRAWRGWRRQVAARMREHGWLSSEHLPAIVAAGLRDGRIAPPAQVELAGFERGLPPAQRAVLDALAAVTAVREHARPARPGPRVQVLRVADDAAMLRFVAETVRRRLAPHAGGDSLPPRIVVALPDPDLRRAALEDALIERVTPLLRQPAIDDADRARAPWRWDAASALADTPWTAGLQALVDFDARDNTPEASSRLLLCAWFADPPRHAAAATVDLKLREAGHLRIAAAGLAELAPTSLREVLAALTEVIGSAPRRALPSRWSEHFAARLDAAGWPAAGALPSAAFQTVHELRRALTALAALDAQTGPVDAARARLWLRELLKRRFEPRTEHAQPVRLLAADDAIGIDCDLLIVVDADAANFPGPARPTPFLPIERQRAAGVPQASPAAWLTHRRAEIAALMGGAHEVIALAPRLDARGGDVLPSPLFAVDWSDAPPAALASRAEQLALDGPHTVLPTADPVPPVVAEERLSAGTRLFEQFAAAPFLAFAAQRLGIQPLPEVAHGLPAQVQGTLIHAALADFWKQTQDATSLRALTPAARQARIETLLQPLIRKHLPVTDYGRTLVRLEAARLTDVLGAWLAFEAARDDDYTVIDHERPLKTTLAGLPLSLRIDRIERGSTLAAGVTLVDYKTGARVDPKGWREDALAAPQLPLYAVLLDDAALADGIGDIAFAHVADGTPAWVRWTVWSQGRLKPPPVHAGNFAAQRAAWRTALEAVVAGFLAGRADIDADQLKALAGEPLIALAGLVADEDADDAGGEAGA